MNKQQLKKTTTQGDFIFHKEWLDIFQGFSTEKAGLIIKALVDYAKSGIKPADPEIAAICTFLFANVDIDRERIAAAHAPRKKSSTAEPTPSTIPHEDATPEDAKPDSTPKQQPQLTDKEKKLWDKIMRKYHYYGNVAVKAPNGKTVLLSPQEAFAVITNFGHTLTSHPAIHPAKPAR